MTRRSNSGFLKALVLAAEMLLFAIVSASPVRASSHDSNLVALAARQFANLTRAERAMLDYVDLKNINRGEFAVAGPSSDPNDPSNNPKYAEEWRAEREVRAALIRWLCVDPVALRRVDPQGIRLLGARITGILNLSHVHAAAPLVLIRCSIPGLIKLNSAELPELDLDGSYTGRIFAEQIKVMGPLRMGLGFHAAEEVDLSRANVEGDVALSGGHFTHSTVEPLPWGSEFKMALVLDHAQIRGSLIMCCDFEADGSVLMWNTSIGGDLVANGGRFINPGNVALQASETEIGSDFALGEENPSTHGEFEANGAVDLIGAKIGVLLTVNRAKFRGARSDRHGLFAALMNARALIWRNVLLENDAVLDLSGAQIAFLIDEQKSWPKPGKLFIDGFRYEGISVDSPSDVASRLRWIGLNANPDDPQPYDQLAKVYRAKGAMSTAAQVLIARDDVIFNGRGPVYRIWGTFLKTTIGYGHSPLLTVFWMLGVVIAGWALVAIGKRAGVMRLTWSETPPPPAGDLTAGLSPLLYSLDVFLPFVNLHQEHYWWPDERAVGNCRIAGLEMPVRGSTLRIYLWLQIIAGWLLSAVFVAGLTGLLRSD